jgi:hypothetical protein
MKFKQKRGIWKNLGLALAGTPAVVICGIVIIALVGAVVGFLDDAITKFQLREQWWILLIIGYCVSLIYVYYEPRYKQNRERKKFADALILHWKFQLVKQNKTPPSETEIEPIRDMLIERIKVWAWSDPQLWARFYPDEKYSEDPFEILSALMSWWEEWKKGRKKSRTE